MLDICDVKEIKTDLIKIPQFRDRKLMTNEELTDPDYRLKILQKQYGGKYIIGCSKCHHCR
jgi:aerobic-type carbon monoxide dehydrogenase small subunit (CoxS/CutS family)